MAFSFAGVFGPSNVTPQQFQSYGATASLNYEGHRPLAGARASQRRAQLQRDPRGPGQRRRRPGRSAGRRSPRRSTPMTLAPPIRRVLATINDFENLARRASAWPSSRWSPTARSSPCPAATSGWRWASSASTRTSSSSSAADRVSATGPVPSSFASRRVNAVFAEVLVPIVGPDNARPGLRAPGALGLRPARRLQRRRRDHESEDRLQLQAGRGPDHPRQLRHLVPRAGPADHLEHDLLADPDPARSAPSGPATSPITDLFRPTIVIAGGNPNLRPETAKTW